MTVKLPDIRFKNLNAYDEFIAEASDIYGVPFLVIKAVIATESGFNPNAEAGTTSARGLMQITKAAAIDVGVEHSQLFDPKINIFAGTKYLAMQIKECGLAGGIRAYYEGAGNRRKNSDLDPHNDRPDRALESAQYLAKVYGYQTALTLNPKNWRIFT